MLDRSLRVAASLLIACPLAASAQRDTARLGDLVVTATRVPTPANDVAAATTVLHGDDLRARGIHLLLDALREVPGLNVVQTGSDGAVTSVFLRGGESDYVKVLLDGVPLNLPGGAVDFANLTTADIDRVEIVRGAASVLYGADAMSGVIQIFTRSATERGSVELAGDGGTFGTNDFSSHIDAAGRRWSISATGARVGSDGFYAFNDEYRNAVGTAQLGFDDGAAGQARLMVRYGDGVSHFPTDGEGNPVDHNQFTQARNTATSLNASRALGSQLSVHLLGFADREHDGYTNRMDTPADTNGFDYVEDRGVVAWRRGVDARLDWRAYPGTLLSLGAGLEHETDNESDIGTSNFGFGASTDTTALTGTRTTHDVYGQALADPWHAISLQLGVRFDDNSAFGSFGTWRGGVTWHLAPTARLWAAAGTAFKSPTFAQLFATSAYEVGNPDLAPERSNNQELGAATTLVGDQITVSASAFWQQFRDLIQYISAAPGEPTYTNLGGADSRGIEASLAWRATHQLTVAAHWTWLHTAVTDTGVASSVSDQPGQPLIRRPSRSGGATVAYRWHGTTIASTLTSVGSRADVDYSGTAPRRVILPAYATVDLALVVPIRRVAGHSPGFDVTLRGDNLFDADYQQVVGYPGRGRRVLAGARLVF